MEKLETTCPYCKIGFGVMCTAKDKFDHMDIMWSNEAGMAVKCKEPEKILPYIVENTTYGTGFSLSPEMEETFEALNNSFHTDPSAFSKENIPFGDFNILVGEFIRYAEYMDSVTPKEGITYGDINNLYNEGKNIMEVIKETTIPD